MRSLLLALVLLAGCGDDLTPDLAGTWSYDWELRPPTDTWDGHFRGVLTLQQFGADVTGDLGYPDEDPATLYNDPAMREAWVWPVFGTLVGRELHLFAPAPNTKWDDSWLFRLAVGASEMAGTGYAGAGLYEQLTFRAVRR